MRKFRITLPDGTEVRIGHDAELPQQTLALGWKLIEAQVELDELRERLAALEARS